MAAESEEYNIPFVVTVTVMNTTDILAGDPMQVAVEFPDGHQELAMQVLKHAVLAYYDRQEQDSALD